MIKFNFEMETRDAQNFMWLIQNSLSDVGMKAMEYYAQKDEVMGQAYVDSKAYLSGLYQIMLDGMDVTQ